MRRMNEEYWELLENEAKLSEVNEHSYIDEYINAGYVYTLSRIQSNKTGGKKPSAE